MRYNIPLYEIQTREEEAAMRKLLVLLLALLLALSAAACGKEEELEPWTMPEVDTKPTPVRTPVPTFGGGNPESFVWNEVEFLNMALPGADPASRQEKHTHKQALALFPYNFLPASIFGESYAKYEKLTLKKTEHEVMLDEAGQLPESEEDKLMHETYLRIGKVMENLPEEQAEVVHTKSRPKPAEEQE